MLQSPKLKCHNSSIWNKSKHQRWKCRKRQQVKHLSSPPLLGRRHICITLLVHLRCIQTQMLLPLSCGYTQSPSKPGLSGCLLLISSSFAEFPLQMLTVFQRLLELRLFCEEQNLSPLKTSALELCQLQISHIKYKVLDRSFAIICNLVNIFHWIGSSI